MKKTFLLILITLITFFPAYDHSPAFAEEGEIGGSEDIEKTFSDILDGIDLEGYQEVLEWIDNEYSLNFTDKIKNIITDVFYQRSDLGAEYLLKTALELTVGNINAYLFQMGAVLIICLLLSLLKNISSGFASRSIEKIVYLSCYSMIVSIVLSISGVVVSDTLSLIEIFTVFTENIFPPLLSLMTALGSVSAASLYQPSLLFFSATVMTIIKKIVLPLFYLCFVLTVVGHFNEEISLKKAVKTARSLSEWILSIFFGLFTAITTAKGIAGSGMDSFALRSAKYALSGYVPIVGNYLKEGFDVVLASCYLVKNAVGVTAVLLLFLLILSPLIKVLLAIFALRITASVVEPFGEQKVSSMLYDLSDCLKMLIVLILCVSFSLFILLMLILITCNGGVI